MSRTSNIPVDYKPRPKKRLGQHFLIDKAALGNILDAARLSSEDYVLEIGSGSGNLSVLLAKQAGRFYALEKDTAFNAVLKSRLKPFPCSKIIFTDILAFDIKEIFEGRKYKVIGNIPYYITSPIITRLIEQREYIDTILITIQKEVAQRIVACPGTKNYGRLSILAQFYTSPELITIFPKKLFSPAPEVDSALIRLKILSSPSISVASEKTFFRVVKAIFAQRRKTLLNGLLAAGFAINKETMLEILKKTDITPSCRGEQLKLCEIGRLSDAIEGYSPQKI
ncbi:MAG: 16S rRNA (adenine(1518)-N(6)/adenine(1519)-N(6))-dimethyltransferase RsmA [Candidatus Omnitrophica bacterium]|nr:16S rRNA (adenine(1518)-N(6)/adenine(1519)-N(6))-dimethyltransferase RsmA [Candidatus Omnitrophota bacterium]